MIESKYRWSGLVRSNILWFVIDVDSLRSRFERMSPFLDERGRRLFAANEAISLGRGGVTAVAVATGIARSTINRGVAELKAAHNEIGRGIRRCGAGRKRETERQPGLLAALEGLIEEAIRGDSEVPLRWVSRSQRNIAEALRRQGFRVSQKLVGRLLREQQYSCQANRKTREGSHHPDRNAQFDHINTTIRAAIAAGNPAISVDTKKKELVGDFKNGGRELRRKGDPEPVRVHDFEIKGLGKVAPYGVYDIAANKGWVNVGNRCRHRRICRREHPPLVATARQRALSRGSTPHHHGRLWRQQRRPRPPLETRTSTLCRRDRPRRNRRPPAARYQQVEPHRAPPLCLHLPELAWQATGQPPSHDPTDRRHYHQYRPHRHLRHRPQPLPERN